MTTEVDVVNDALQRIGTRTTVASLTEQSNEAIQASLSLESTRNELIRMAPWNCVNAYVKLTYITSLPGTPENQAGGQQDWGYGLPPPGWAYMYQYPVDCMRALSIIPQMSTGSSGGVPITQAITSGGTQAGWRRGPPIAFKVGVEHFVSVVSASVAVGGTGYALRDVITLASGPPTAPPIGAPASLSVTGVLAGAVTAVTVFNDVFGSDPARGGSYLVRPTNPVAQGSTDGNGTGAQFIVGLDPPGVLGGNQRVILAQTEQAILCYNRAIRDPNVMDPLFLDAWSSLLGAKLALALTGDKALANMQIQLTNQAIVEARKADGNEGLTVIDNVPDWIRTRGIYFPLVTGSPSDVGFDWGGLFPTY